MKRRKKEENGKAELNWDIDSTQSGISVQKEMGSLKGGDFVELLLHGQVVGIGKLLPGSEGNANIQKVIHNVLLAMFEKDGQNLVSCYSFQAKGNVGNIEYPYKYGGVEPPPKLLEGLTGIFSWDLNEMRASN